MKHILIVLTMLIMLLTISSCGFNNTEKNGIDNEYQNIEHYGIVPEQFTQIVENNIFRRAVAFEDRILKSNINGDEYSVIMYDFYGNELAHYQGILDENCSIESMAVTEDGGFLFSIGFHDKALADGKWASEKGYYSRVIKCDASGNALWNIVLDNYNGKMLRYCLEHNGEYYFFGNQETPATKKLGVHSPTDIYVLKLSSNGEILKTATIAGSDYDSLTYVEYNGVFLLYGSTQSKDGDFQNADKFKDSAVDFKIIIDNDLNVISKTTGSFDIYDTYIGVVDKKIISFNDLEYTSFDGGNIEAILQYDDFYLTISENRIGLCEKEHNSMISALCYKNETVYSAYDKDGQLLWRTSKEWSNHS